MTLQEFLNDCEHKGAAVEQAFRRDLAQDQVFETWKIVPPVGGPGQVYYFTDYHLNDVLSQLEIDAARRVLCLFVRHS